MSHPLNRRRALIVAGQGMAAVLVAACGGAAEQSSATTLRSAVPGTAESARTVPEVTTPDVTMGEVTTPEVTVPGLGSTGARTLLPLTPTATTPSATTPSATTPTHVLPTATTPAAATTATPTTATISATNTRAAEPTTTTPGTARPTPATTPTGASSPTVVRRRPVTGVAGRLVAIDPGHNGANAAHPEIINQLIDGGYGQRNVCNTTGTQTDAGYPEHQFTWQVAGYLRQLLEAAGVTVLMTRTSDTGVGPCTNVRAAMENKADADAVVSIHGDGAPPSVRGFYVLTATRPPAGTVVAAQSLRLAAAIAAAAVANGFPPSNTLGSGGLWKRDDLTGLNLSMRPKILIECGNMRNAVEAALMSSASGQRRYAQALADGVFAYLKGAGPSAR